MVLRIWFYASGKPVMTRGVYSQTACRLHKQSGGAPKTDAVVCPYVCRFSDRSCRLWSWRAHVV